MILNLLKSYPQKNNKITGPSKPNPTETESQQSRIKIFQDSNNINSSNRFNSTEPEKSSIRRIHSRHGHASSPNLANNSSSSPHYPIPTWSKYPRNPPRFANEILRRGTSTTVEEATSSHGIVAVINRRGARREEEWRIGGERRDGNWIARGTRVSTYRRAPRVSRLQSSRHSSHLLPVCRPFPFPRV